MVFFFLWSFSRNLDDQFSWNFNKDTPSETTGIWQLPKVYLPFKSNVPDYKVPCEALNTQIGKNTRGKLQLQYGNV